MARKTGDPGRACLRCMGRVGLLLACALMLGACSSSEGDPREPVGALDPGFLMYLSEWDEADAAWLDELAGPEAVGRVDRDEERDE